MIETIAGGCRINVHAAHRIFLLCSRRSERRCAAAAFEAPMLTRGEWSVVLPAYFSGSCLNFALQCLLQK